jgi:putative addiction module component (TIGR02574 family)
MVGRELHRHCHLLLFSRYPYWMAIPTIDEIVQLSPAERLYLIGQLWDSLEQQDLPLSQGQEAELNRRLASIEQTATEL